MSHTYTSCHFHCMFSTKGRLKVLTDEIRERLFPYMVGIARNNGFRILEVGGVEDHVHLLLSHGPAQNLSKCMQLIKGGSCKWIHETWTTSKNEWQEGYAAFSIGINQIQTVEEYIRSQTEHHRKKSFEEEYLSFLREHRIPYDEKYVLG